MADDIVTHDFSSSGVTADTTYGPISIRGKRNIIASLEVQTVTGSGTPSLTCALEETLVDSSLQSGTSYWKNIFYFSNVTDATSLPFYEIKSKADNGSRPLSVARYIQIRYLVSGNSPTFKGRTRVGYDKAITE